MTTAREYDIQQELVHLADAEFLTDRMGTLGWKCIGQKVVDCATGSIQLHFRRMKNSYLPQVDGDSFYPARARLENPLCLNPLSSLPFQPEA